ncbi:MAG TPA: hypothetical protein VMX76_01350 [Nevskiaceae bacterium]|nr:hypothetical protein [Nevskiaceae bacterium]
MPKIPNQLKNGAKQVFTKFVTKTIPALLLSFGLFAGGIALLALRIPGWSLILGLPAVQVGIIFLIFTFDEIARSKVGPDNLHSVPCSVCGKSTLAPEWQKEKICEECQKKVAKKLKMT